jgi:Bacterial membrane protein YfhO
MDAPRAVTVSSAAFTMRDVDASRAPETATTPLGHVVLAALVVAAAEVGVASWSGGFGSRVGSPDLYALFLPRFRYVAQTYLGGHFPLWNPYESCGRPLHGSSYGMALYPPVVLANLVLPAVPAIRVLFSLHIAALVLWTLLYLRRTGICLGGGVVAAVLATTSIFNGAARAGVDQPHMIFSVAWVPAILLAWEGAIEGKRWMAALTALFLALQWLPGYPEFSLATALILVVMAVLDRRASLVRRLALTAVVVATGALVAAAHVVPVVEMVGESNRMPGSDAYRLSRFFFAVHSIREFVDFSLRRYGAAGVFCLVLGLIRHTPYRRQWAAAFVLTTFIMNPPLLSLFEVWPFSGLRVGYGWNALFPFFAGCLAAAGVHRLRHAEGGWVEWVPPATGAAVIAGAFATGHPFEAAVAAACMLAVWTPLRARGGWVVPIALVALHGILVMNTIGTDERMKRPPDAGALSARVPVLRDLQQRFDTRLIAGPELRAGLLLPEHLSSAAGYEPSNPPRRVARLTSRLGLEFLATGTEWPRSTWYKVADNPGVASTLGMGLIAVNPMHGAPLMASGYRQVARLPDGDVVLYRAAAPRFQLIRRVQPASDEEESFRLVTEGGFDPTTTVILEEQPPFPIAPRNGTNAPEALTVVVNLPEQIVLDATLAGPAMLVVADTYFPGWRARVDGTPAPLMRANYAFRAVPLAGGAHSVELTYAPRSFRVGLLLSLLGLTLVAALAMAPRWL